MTAHQITKLINLTTDAVLSEKMSYEAGSLLNKELWLLAQERGLLAEVTDELQEQTEQEMQTAIRRTLPQD
jgi:hypothetical protein